MKLLLVLINVLEFKGIKINGPSRKHEYTYYDEILALLILSEISLWNFCHDVPLWKQELLMLPLDVIFSGKEKLQFTVSNNFISSFKKKRTHSCCKVLQLISHDRKLFIFFACYSMHA
ncbi:unnamed protein product [Rotaria socialis]